MNGAMGRTGHRLASAIIAAAMLCSGGAPSVGAAAPDVTGWFMDWTRDDIAPSDPVNLDPASIMAVAANGGTAVAGRPAGGQLPWWSVLVYRLDGAPPVVGPIEGAQIAGSGWGCSMPAEASGSVLEAEYAADGSPTRFAANLELWCTQRPMYHTYVEVRFHSTVGYHAFAISPLAAASYVPPDLDLGDSSVGGPPATGAFTVTNTGSLPLTVGTGAFSNAAFEVLPGGCDAGPVAAGESCTIDLAFTPTEPGRIMATVDLLKPDFPFATRELRVRARGTVPTSVSFRMIDEPPGTDAPWWPTMEFTWTPADKGLNADVDFTCGNGMHGALVPSSPFTFTTGIVLQAGPCDATATVSGYFDSGLLESSSSIHFTVPAYADIQVGRPVLPYVKAGETVLLTGQVVGANGVTPDGGTLTIDDETQPARLYEKVITAADNTVHVEIGPRNGGWHRLRLVYADDPKIETRTAWMDLYMDDAAPTGTAVVAGGAAFTPSSQVSVALTSADSGSGVDIARLSPTAAVKDGRLVDGEDAPSAGTVDWTLAAGNGVRSVYVQWRDKAGNWSVPISRSLTVDAAGPTVTAPAVSLRPGAGVGVSLVPVHVSFVATDAGSGTAATCLEVSRDGGLWTAVPGAGTSLTVHIQPGHAYRFRGVAHDRAGNVRTGPTSGSVRVGLVQESSTAITTHGTWTPGSVAGTSGGSAIWSRVAGASASFRFYGGAIAWLSPLGPGRGTATVRIDGRTVGTFSLWHGSQTVSRLIMSHRWATNGWHRIDVVVAGGVGARRVDVDGFVVLR